MCRLTTLFCCALGRLSNVLLTQCLLHQPLAVTHLNCLRSKWAPDAATIAVILHQLCRLDSSAKQVWMETAAHKIPAAPVTSLAVQFGSLALCWEVSQVTYLEWCVYCVHLLLLLEQNHTLWSGIRDTTFLSIGTYWNLLDQFEEMRASFSRWHLSGLAQRRMHWGLVRVPHGPAPRSWVQGIPHVGHWVCLKMTDTYRYCTP